jgi:6-phosphogluconolactonase (cycloisomerase 2 family)
MTMLSGSTVNLPVGSSPSHVLIRPGIKQSMFGILYKGKKIGSYNVTGQGILTRTSTLNFPAAPVGGVLNPLVRGIYVTLAASNQLGVVTYDSTFKLAAVKILADPGKAPCWAVTNKAGTRMYTGETLTGTVSVWDITTPKSPVALQTVVMSGTVPYATHIELDPTEKFLYVLDRHGVLHVLDVAADGTVAENHVAYNLGLPDNTVPPLGIAVLMK